MLDRYTLLIASWEITATFLMNFTEFQQVLNYEGHIMLHSQVQMS